jgi:hypothetical protein
MMLPINTTDIYEKVKIGRLKCIRMMRKQTCRCAFFQTINIFPRTLRFFTISFNRANDVYVKIYETAQFFKSNNKYPR